MIDDENNPLALLDLRVRIVHGLVAALGPYNEGQARLDRLAPLWRELKRAPKGSGACEAMVKQIRAESDTYSAIVDAQLKQGKPGEPKD